jgi:hypothetical protein
VFACEIDDVAREFDDQIAVGASPRLPASMFDRNAVFEEGIAQHVIRGRFELGAARTRLLMR